MQEESGRQIAAFSLIGLGGLFLLGQWTDFDIFGNLWTLFVLIPGLACLTIALRAQDKKTVGFIFPGIIVTGTALILSYQNLTGHWESWAYIWSLYPAMVGLGLQFVGRRTDDNNALRVGRTMSLVASLAFVGLAALFELFIFNGVGFGVLTAIVPLGMIAVGLYLLLHSRLEGKSKRKAHDY